MAENLELTMHDFQLHEFVHACQSTAGRGGSLRYRDPDEMLAMSGRAAKEVAVQFLAARKRAKSAWLQELLDRAASGDLSRSKLLPQAESVSPVSAAGVRFACRRLPQSTL